AALNASFADVPLRLSGLTPLVEGAVYEGTPDQIHDAFVAAKMLRLPIERLPDTVTGGWQFRVGEKMIEIRDVSQKVAPQGPPAGEPPKVQPPSPVPPVRPPSAPRSEESFGTGTRPRRLSALDRGRGARPFYAKDPKKPPAGAPAAELPPPSRPYEIR